jgi:3'-5' exonuclease
MIKEIPLSSILFIDIETIPNVSHYDKLSMRMRELYQGKMRFMKDPLLTEEELYSKAGIYAEFGRIVCISGGKIDFRNSVPHLEIRSWSGHDEKELLENFCNDLTASKEIKRLCAHNGREFDFPWLCRRLIIQDMKIPPILEIQGKRPWEIQHIDTMDLWKFGDYKHYTSLDLLTEILGVPSPKDDLTGADVGRVYWEDDDLPRIVNYCQKDVLALTQVFLRLRGDRMLDEEQVHVQPVLINQSEHIE